MQKDADSFISRNEKEFILKALEQSCRLDGRGLFEFRRPSYKFSLDDSSVTVGLGKTRVLGAIKATLDAPYPDRPSEGSVFFNVEFSPMASPAFEPGRPGEDAIEVARLVERGLRQSQAVDQEALCVLAGRKVWSLRVDLHVVDHDGNLVDACCLAALAALMAFRKQETTLGGPAGTDVIVQPPEVQEPLPLTLHHLPVAVTYALFQDGDTLVADPSRQEEAAAEGSVTFVTNPGGEVCCVHKADGIGLTTQQFLRALRLAAGQGKELVASLKAALEQHQVARVQARVMRRRQAVGLPQAGRHVAIMEGARGDAIIEGPVGQLPGASAALLGTKALAGAKPSVAHGSSASAMDIDADADLIASSSSDEDDYDLDGETEASSGGEEAGTNPAVQIKEEGGVSAHGKASSSQPTDPATAPSPSGNGPKLKTLGGMGPGSAAGHKGSRGKQGGDSVGSPEASRPKKTFKDDLKFDELEAIAAVVAGAGQAGTPGKELTLADAVKKEKLGSGKKRKGTS